MKDKLNMKTKQLPDESKRLSLLHRIEDRLEIPMLVLSFIWLVLLILEFTTGLSDFLENINSGIWIVFIVDYAVRFTLAPVKIKFLKESWLTGVALLLPALRLFRIFRAVRVLKATSAIRTLRFARIITSMNRGIAALGKTLRRRGFGYVISLTLLVLLLGAAGMLSFEKELGSIDDYSTALWWTAMVLTTMGTDYFPQTSEGRMLCLLLAIYGFAVFGYVTAAVATFFVGQDAESDETDIASQATLQELKERLDQVNEKLNVLINSDRK